MGKKIAKMQRCDARGPGSTLCSALTNIRLCLVQRKAVDLVPLFARLTPSTGLVNFARKTASLPLLVKLFCFASNKYSLAKREEPAKRNGSGCGGQGALNCCSDIICWLK